MWLFEKLGMRKVEDISNSRNDYTSMEDLLQKADVNTWDTVQKLRDVSSTKSAVFKEYENMANDVFIASALELYADDAVQSEIRTGRLVWITAKDKDLQSDLDVLMDELEIESRVWDWAHNVAHYGELFLKLFFDEQGRLLKYVEEVSDPGNLLDLQYMGKTEYFATVQNEVDGAKKVQKLTLQDPDSYVHFMIRKANRFDEIDVKIPKVEEDGTTTTEVQQKYKVARGVSILEPLRSSYRILRLLEDSLIVARLSRSAMIRMFSVEVGTAPPKKAREMVNKLKKLLDSQEQVDVQSGEFASKKSPGPIDDPLIIPTRNGKGSVSYQNIGGDVDVRSITDIDYFRNKMFAGLKVPKAFLGFEEFLPGGMGQSPLTKLDVRYARTVKRVQNAVRDGIKKLLNLYLIDQGRDGQVNQFEVHMTEPSSSEEADRMVDMSNRIALADSMMRLLDTETTKGMFDNYKLVSTILKEVLKYEELQDTLLPHDKYKEFVKQQEEQMASGEGEY
ncbi:portal vertex protein of head [Bacillus phage SP-15]|uniref:Portal vertex protein of head n=1 Tax=Bacillus phage SP-15 TaxID=1792032 RepID=A0A127AVY1_9CAUD|nr:portal vertex protein of head [Bacillus phage SP-15]AMM44826.1 portal vertex protein of head [Bacillus phage SP-15]